MEQSNLIANGMTNGMAPQNINRMQQPQPGNSGQQLHARIVDGLRRKSGTLPPGWQTTFDVGQRAIRIMQLVSQLRILGAENPRCLNIAEGFEERTIHESPNQEVYFERLNAKMTEISQKRQQQASNGQMSMMQITNNMVGMSQSNLSNVNPMHNGAMAGANVNMNAIGMSMGTPGHGMGMPNAQINAINGQQNQSFPTQLQRQMQPSALPQQPQLQQQSNTMDPSALQTTQMPPQMHNMAQPSMQQRFNPNHGGQPSQPSQPYHAEIQAQAKRMYSTMSEEKKASVRAQYLSNLNEQQRQSLKGAQSDPLLRFLMVRAREVVLRQKAAEQNNAGGMPMANNMGMPNSNVQQNLVSQPGNPNFDLTSLAGLQANAIKSQESGGEVVPASNNTDFGIPGQTSMSQAVNPAMLGNQSSQNNLNAHQQMQYFALQQERNKRLQQQNQMAQQQALANQQAQSQLQGQPGGLNTPNALNGGQVNSPAMNMNMLTRPMAPPGQATPSTPQRPQAMPQTSLNPANQLAQHHQSMLSQNGQNNQQMNAIGMTPQQRLLATLPPPAREKLLNMPQEQITAALQQLAMRYNQQQQAALMHNQQGPTVMPANVNIRGPQMVNQQSMANGMAPNMNTAVPGFNSQPPMNQQSLQPNQDPVARQQRAIHHQYTMIRQRTMDAKPFPRGVLQSLGMQVPEDVTDWGKLRQYIMNNQSVLPQNSIQKLQAAQSQWFEQHPEELQAAMQLVQQRLQQNVQLAAQNHGQQQQQQQQQPPNSRPQSIPNAQPQAPPAQMVPPAAPMQQPNNANLSAANMNLGQIRMPQQTLADIDVQGYREKMPGAQSMTDDQIRQAIMRRKQQQTQAATAQMQQSMRNAQMQQQQPAGQPVNVPRGGQQPQQAQRPPQVQQGPRVNAQAQGQKRPPTNNDDVIEIPDPSGPAASQAPPTQPATTQMLQARQGMTRPPTKDEFQKMTVDERTQAVQHWRQADALRKVQQGLANNQNAASGQLQTSQQQLPAVTPKAPQQQQQQSNSQQSQPSAMNPEQFEQFQQVLAKVRTMWTETLKDVKKGPAVQLDSQSLEDAKAVLKKLWTPTLVIDKTFVSAFRLFGEQRVRDAMRFKRVVEMNANDADGNFKDYLGVTPAELKQLEAFAGAYFHDLQRSKNAQQSAASQAQPTAPNVAQTQKAQTQQSAKAQPKQQAPPLNRKQSQSGHARKASASTKAPPAPTENKTFDWGATSPHGIPKYDHLRNDLTPDKLKFPPQKKRRTGQQADSTASTPADQTGTPSASNVSPGIAKAATPEQIRKMQPQVPKAAERVQPQFKCDDPTCEESLTGFDTEELLNQHMETMHQPIENPLQFLLDITAVDEQQVEGKGLTSKKDAQAPAKSRGKPAPVAKVGVKGEGQTSAIKQESTISAPSAKAVGKLGIIPSVKPDPEDKRDSIVNVVEKEKTLMDVMKERIGWKRPTEVASQPAVVDEPIETSHEEWTASLPMHFNESYGLVDEDWSEFIGADFGLPDSSPELTELTPGSLVSQSSRESDISQSERLRVNLEWDPNGNGDTYVPHQLMQKLGLREPASGAAKQDDAMIVEGGDVSKEGDAKQVEDPMDWSGDDVDFDTLFGSNSGLYPDGSDWSSMDISGRWQRI